MATLNGSTDIVIGYGRNDGTRRVYVSWMNGLTEFTWTGTAWQALTLSSNEPGWVHGICMGHGRNDGVNRIYTANQGAGDVFEYTWNGTTFAKTLVDTTVTDTRNVGIGEGRNDGVIRLYSAGGDGNGYEYSWTGSAWQKATMGNSGIGGLKVHATPTRARDDGLVRVYLAAANGGVYEMSWTGSGWQSTTLGQATAYMYGLDIGDALGRGRPRSTAPATTARLTCSNGCLRGRQPFRACSVSHRPPRAPQSPTPVSWSAPSPRHRAAVFPPGAS